MAIIKPIWKAIEVDMTSELENGVVDFSVSAGGVTVYSGRAYADADDTCIVRLNDIIRDHLGKDVPVTGTLSLVDTKAVIPVTVTFGESSESFKVINDWSYDDGLATSDVRIVILSDAVIDRWDYRTTRPITIINATHFTYTFYDVEGEVVTSGEYNFADGQLSVTLFAKTTVPGQLVISTGGVRPYTISYNIGEYCDAGTLYYRNTRGGYDMLPLASIVENERYTRETFDKMNTPVNTRHIYHEDMTRRYTLRTPVLTDEQAAKIGAVIGTPWAYLYTPERGYVPVIMTTEEYKRKTYKNEGRKRVVYEFEVETAQDMERR